MKKSKLPSNFLSYLQSGSLKINLGDQPIATFTATESEKVLDIIDMPIKLSGKPNFFKQLSEAKDLAKNLKQKNTTLEIRHKGQTVLKLGKEAKPRLAKIVTLSSDMEISDMGKLKELGKIF